MIQKTWIRLTCSQCYAQLNIGLLTIFCWDIFEQPKNEKERFITSKSSSLEILEAMLPILDKFYRTFTVTLEIGQS
jgi:hypothetical protein